MAQVHTDMLAVPYLQKEFPSSRLPERLGEAYTGFGEEIRGKELTWETQT